MDEARGLSGPRRSEFERDDLRGTRAPGNRQHCQNASSGDGSGLMISDVRSLAPDFRGRLRRGRSNGGEPSHSLHAPEYEPEAPGVGATSDPVHQPAAEPTPSRSQVNESTHQNPSRVTVKKETVTAEYQEPQNQTGPVTVNPARVTGGFYRCGFQGCRFTALMSTGLKDHLLSRHYDNNRFPCYHCGSEEPNIGRLLEHFNSHLNEMYRDYYCPVKCGTHSINIDKVVDHIRLSHNVKVSIPCWGCSRRFERETFCSHIKNNTLLIVPCRFCPAKATDKDEMANHIMTSHPDESCSIRIENVLLCQGTEMSDESTCTGQHATSTATQGHAASTHLDVTWRGQGTCDEPLEIADEEDENAEVNTNTILDAAEENVHLPEGGFGRTGSREVRRERGPGTASSGRGSASKHTPDHQQNNQTQRKRKVSSYAANTRPGLGQPSVASGPARGAHPGPSTPSSSTSSAPGPQSPVKYAPKTRQSLEARLRGQLHYSPFQCQHCYLATGSESKFQTHAKLKHAGKDQTPFYITDPEKERRFKFYLKRALKKYPHLKYGGD